MASILWTYVMLKSDKKPENDFETIIDDCERCEAQGITERELNAGLPKKDWGPEGWLKKRKAEAVAARDRPRAQRRQEHDSPPPQLTRAMREAAEEQDTVGSFLLRMAQLAVSRAERASTAAGKERWLGLSRWFLELDLKWICLLPNRV